MNIPEEIQIEVFRTGDYGEKGCYSEADLDRIADTYNPSLHEAPVTFDHDQKGPAHGWVKHVRRAGDRLVATIVRISETLHQAITSHRFKKRSIELYRRFAQTGAPYLKAISFLGAAAPEVKGLADPAFSATCVPPSDCVAIPIASDPAREARLLLIERNLWRPGFEERGVAELLASLEDTPHRDTLLALLAENHAPVTFGALASETPQAAVAFTEDLVGGADAESIQLHRRACQLLLQNPSLTYRDALLRLN